MATTTYKILGQLAAASAITATEAIYTVPASKEAVLSTVTVTNRSSGTAVYRIAVRPNGTAAASQHYIAYDSYIAGNDTIALTLGITMDAADIIAAYASNANLTFNCFGAEITL